METFYHIFVVVESKYAGRGLISYINLDKIEFHAQLYSLYSLDQLVDDLKCVKNTVEITPDYIQAYINSINSPNNEFSPDIEMYMSKENGELEVAEVDYKLLTQFVIAELNEAD